MTDSWASNKPVLSQSWASYNPVMSQSWESHETVMKQSWDSPAEFLKVLTRLLLPVTKVYPQMLKSHTSVKNIANRLKNTRQFSPLISFPSYGLLDVNALQAVGNILDSGVGLPHLWVHLCRWQEQPCQHLQELRWRVSWLFHDCLMTVSWLANDWLMTGSISINPFSAINFQQ